MRPTGDFRRRPFGSSNLAMFTFRIESGLLQRSTNVVSSGVRSLYVVDRELNFPIASVLTYLHYFFSTSFSALRPAV